MNGEIIRIRLTGIILMVITQISVAQTFIITRVEVEGTKLNFFYDLYDNVASHTYTIKLFSSRDNFTVPLQKVTGDVGLQVTPGETKKVVWNISDEFGADFEDKLSFQISGSLYVPFIKLDQNYTKLKRSKEYDYTWTGDTTGETLNVELQRGGEKMGDLPSAINEKKYTLKVPSSLKAGKSYRLKIYDSGNEDRTVFTNEFIVKRKTPLFIKVFPILALGAGAYLFLGNSTNSNHLPDPIKP